MSLSRDERDSAVRKAYEQRNKNSSSVRSLEEIKSEMSYWENEQKNYSDRLFEEQGGFRIFTADKEKVKQLEEGMEDARRNYKRVEEEYKNHPDYYEDKYWYDSGFEKGIKGIVDSAVATVPVVAKTAASAVKEAESKMESEEYAAARQAEEVAWNKLNDYAASYFGSFDMIDQSELDRLSQEYQQATDHRKTLEKQYEQPVDLDSNSMKLMEEAVWLKNSATKDLSGVSKFLADAAIDAGQGIALLPLMLGGAGVYTAGTATNAAAESMYNQTANGKSAGNTLLSGLATAGWEVASEKLSDFLKKKGTAFSEWLEKVWDEYD